MGRIKSLMVKKAAKQLVAVEKHRFNEDFNNNKMLLQTFMPSKPIRNKVAGYISRLIKMKNMQKTVVAPVTNAESALNEEPVESFG